MEQKPRSPVAGKAEEHSGSTLLTYFQGDINSMVDAHFSRALAKVTKPKEDYTKIKKMRKSNKSEESNVSHWNVQSRMNFKTTDSSRQLEFGRHKETPTNPHVPLNNPARSSSIWLGSPQQAPGLVLPPMVYSSATTADGLMVADHQYSNSLLSLLNSDRPELSSVMVDSTKPEFMSSWARQPRLGDQLTSDHSLESGVQMMEKKDLYWY